MPKNGQKSATKAFFYPTEDVEAILDTIRERNEYGGLTRFVNDAIRRYAETLDAEQQSLPLRFEEPTPEYADLSAFLRYSREVVMLGLTLSSIQRPQVYDLVKEKITEQRTSFVFMLIDRNLAANDELFKLFSHRYGYFAHQHGKFIADLERTYAKLNDLVHLGRQEGVSVIARGLTSVPFCGLTISDPDRDTCRMRVALYLESRATDAPPFLEVATGTHEGRKAANAFMRHYRSLSLDASHDLP